MAHQKPNCLEPPLYTFKSQTIIFTINYSCRNKTLYRNDYATIIIGRCSNPCLHQFFLSFPSGLLCTNRLSLMLIAIYKIHERCPMAHVLALCSIIFNQKKWNNKNIQGLSSVIHLTCFQRDRTIYWYFLYITTNLDMVNMREFQ